MTQIVKHYNLEDLCNVNKTILIETQEGVLIDISVENGLTFISLPFGNEYEQYTTGIRIIPKEKPFQVQEKS